MIRRDAGAYSSVKSGRAAVAASVQVHSESLHRLRRVRTSCQSARSLTTHAAGSMGGGRLRKAPRDDGECWLAFTITGNVRVEHGQALRR